MGFILGLIAGGVVAVVAGDVNRELKDVEGAVIVDGGDELKLTEFVFVDVGYAVADRVRNELAGRSVG